MKSPADNRPLKQWTALAVSRGGRQFGSPVARIEITGPCFRCWVAAYQSNPMLLHSTSEAWFCITASTSDKAAPQLSNSILPLGILDLDTSGCPQTTFRLVCCPTRIGSKLVLQGTRSRPLCGNSSNYQIFIKARFSGSILAPASTGCSPQTGPSSPAPGCPCVSFFQNEGVLLGPEYCPAGDSACSSSRPSLGTGAHGSRRRSCWPTAEA